MGRGAVWVGWGIVYDQEIGKFAVCDQETRNLQGRPVDQTVHGLTDLSNPIVNSNCVGTMMCIPKKQPRGKGLCAGHNNNALIVFWQRDYRIADVYSHQSISLVLANHESQNLGISR